VDGWEIQLRVEVRRKLETAKERVSFGFNNIIPGIVLIFQGFRLKTGLFGGRGKKDGGGAPDLSMTRALG
jgi:hypothetical protein